MAGAFHALRAYRACVRHIYASETRLAALQLKQQRIFWPNEIYVTREFHLSFRGDLKFFQKPCTQEERFEVFPLYT